MDPEPAAAIVADLCASWGPSLLRYGAALTGSRAAAEDLVQEAFMALYRELREGERIGNPRAWTLVVTRNLAGKYRRGNLRYVELPAGVAAAPLPERLVELESLLERLSEREREVLLLRMDSLSYGEIARELGISSGTVGALLTRALGKLRAAVDGGKRGSGADKVKDATRRSS